MILFQNIDAGRLPRVIELVNAGADPNQRGRHGATPLIAALRQAQSLAESDQPYERHVAIATWLIEHNCDVTAVDDWGRTARDWAVGQPSISRMLDERGAGPIEPELTADDEADFPPDVWALLTLLRRAPALPGPDQPTLAKLDPAMPAVIRALVRTWAHRLRSVGWPMGWVNLGYWGIEHRPLLRPDFLDGFNLSSLQFDLYRSWEIGSGYFSEVLILSWEPCGPVRVWSYTVEKWLVSPLGTLEEFLHEALHPTPAPGLELHDSEDLRAWRDYRWPATISPADEPAGQGIRSTAGELLGREARELHELTVPLGPELPAFRSVCEDLRDGILALATAGLVRLRRGTEDITDELADNPDLAATGIGMWVMPLTAAEAIQRPAYPHLIFDVDRPDQADSDSLAETPAAGGQPDLNLQDLALPALRVLAVLLDSYDPVPLARLRPPLGTDSPHLPASLDLARSTVLDLCRRGLATLRVVMALAGLPAIEVLADDARWSAWSSEVCVEVTGRFEEAIGEAAHQLWIQQPQATGTS